MRHLLLSLLALSAVACAKSPSRPYNTVCHEKAAQNDSRPDVLVIGDSISLGYTPFLRALKPGLDFVHNPCNGKSTLNGVMHLDSWLALRDHWSVVTFNHGAWDANPKWGFSDADYRARLTEITQRLKASGKADRLVFLLTTEIDSTIVAIPEGTEDRLNTIALEVMTAEGIEVLDTNTVSKSLTRRDGLHYGAEGSQALAAFITSQIF